MSKPVREANHRIANYAIRMKFVSRVPFICECNDPACHEFILLHPHDYNTQHTSTGDYLTLPGHPTPQPPTSHIPFLEHRGALPVTDYPPFTPPDEASRAGGAVELLAAVGISRPARRPVRSLASSPRQPRR